MGSVSSTFDGRRLLGTFRKGVPGSVAINFTRSGGEHCDNSCPFKAGKCYAKRIEARYPKVAKALAYKEEHRLEYLRALVKPTILRWITSAPWVRFNVSGSLYRLDTLQMQEVEYLMKIAAALNSAGTLYHFPVETEAKAWQVFNMGFRRVRQSLGLMIDLPDTIDRIKSTSFPTSITVAGTKMANHRNAREMAKPSFVVAKQLREQGISAKVCPAVSGKAKCGACTLCAESNQRAIIYPLHM